MKIAIAGASGYTGIELIRLLLKHPKIKLTSITSEQYAGQPCSKIFPSLLPTFNSNLEPLNPEKIAKKADFIFTALPHKEAMQVVPFFIEKKKRVVDLSADFRFAKAETYEKWYQKHTVPHLLSSSVYGLPEINRKNIKNAALVANPGCYPTSVIIPLYPLLKENCIRANNIIADAKSGVTGAGRSLHLTSLFTEVNESFKAYNITTHRHMPEMEEQLSHATGKSVAITFAPHLVPINRGILSTIYADLKRASDRERIQNIFENYYGKEKFVRIFPPDTLPQTGWVRGSNFCDIGFVLDQGRKKLIIISAIDNLIKGASGQAVQNMNIMMGFQENMGLEQIPLFP